jgi:hypothetical protein
MSAPFSIRELASVALPSGCRDGVFLMLRAYFDDAGTHAGAPVAVMGGLIGTVAQWERLEDAWGKRLAAPLHPDGVKPRLGMFHMAACEAADGEFRDYKPVERQAVAQNFRDIIAGANLASTASGVDVAAWDDLVKGEARQFLGSAMEKSFINCLDRVCDFVFDNEDPQVAVVFDQGIESDRLHEVIDIYKKYNDRRVEFCSITFGRVKAIYPLQAADIIATQNYWLAQEYLGMRQTGKSVDISFRNKFKDKPSEGLILDREGIAQDISRRDSRGRLYPEQNFLRRRGIR